MSKPKNSSWWPKVVTLLLWIVLGMSVAYWWLLSQGRGGSPQVAPVSAPLAPQPSSEKVGLALAGGTKAPRSEASAPAGNPSVGGADSRFSLIGLVAAQNGKGVALLAVEGRAAKPFRTGSLVLEPYYLDRVLARSAVLRSKVAGGSELEIKLNAHAPKNAGNTSTFTPPLMGMPPSAIGMPIVAVPQAKVDNGVTGADEARTPVIQRALPGQAFANAAKAAEASTTGASPDAPKP